MNKNLLMLDSVTCSFMMGVHMHSEKWGLIFEIFLIGEIDVSSQRAYVNVRKKWTPACAECVDTPCKTRRLFAGR